MFNPINTDVLMDAIDREGSRVPTPSFNLVETLMFLFNNLSRENLYQNVRNLIFCELFNSYFLIVCYQGVQKLGRLLKKLGV